LGEEVVTELTHVFTQVEKVFFGDG